MPLTSSFASQVRAIILGRHLWVHLWANSGGQKQDPAEQCSSHRNLGIGGSLHPQFRTSRRVIEFRCSADIHGSKRRGIYALLLAQSAEELVQLFPAISGLRYLSPTLAEFEQGSQDCGNTLDDGGNCLWCNKNSRVHSGVGHFRCA
jgi:hypothetical protein